LRGLQGYQDGINKLNTSLKESPKVSPEVITRTSGESNKSRSNKDLIGELFHHIYNGNKDAKTSNRVGREAEILPEKEAASASSTRG
jgi:hypothetical protein